jgi:hypothetical protein
MGNLSNEQKEKLEKLLEKYETITSEQVGYTEVIKHEVRTGNALPIKQVPYPVKDAKRKEYIKNEVQKLEKEGIIRKSISPWASPIVLVEKKNGKLRFCVDYRKLNAVTIKDAYPLPRIEDLLDIFNGKKWFTTLDLAQGYWQVKMEEKDREKTAFVTQCGLYEFNVMPFGLSNAPGTFQRLMNHVLQEYLDEFLTVYIDDIVIYSETFEEHLIHLEKTFRKIKEANLTLGLEKCEFAKEKLKFLGHEISKEGIQSDPDKIVKIQEFKRPGTVKEVRQFLGLTSYYRRFINNFSKIARPINNLLNKDIGFEWKEEQEKAFEELKKRLMETPVLQYPDFNKSFIICTDASEKGLGAVLEQLDDEGKEKPVAYASRSLKPAELNYSVTDLECLAVIWAVQKFYKYLIFKPFEIVTDHAALKTLQTQKIIKGRRAKWIMELQQYNFTIKHRSGRENKNADALSRI